LREAQAISGSGIRNQETGIRSVSGGFAAGVVKTHPFRIGWGERSDAQHLACAKRKPLQGSGFRNQETGIRLIGGGFAAGKKQQNTDRFSSVS
jgi:hypothetical protein